MRQRLSAIGAAVLTLVIVLGACAPAGPAAQPSGSAQPKRGGTLVLARQGEVTNLDPHKVPAFTSARVFELVYSYLMRLDENLGVQPDLAASMPTRSSIRTVAKTRTVIDAPMKCSPVCRAAKIMM